MKKILLYGAGKRGIKVADQLRQKGIIIEGFLDSNKTGTVECEKGKHIYKIFSLDSIIKEKSNYQIIITIANYSERRKVAELLNGIEIITMEDVLKSDSYNIVENNRQYIADYHAVAMEDYYIKAETEDNLNIFWNKNSSFYEMFQSLNLENVIELACGQGRHVEQYKRDAGKITLVDIVDKNILYCKKRFADETKITYYVNNGHDLSELESGAYSAVFSYDAMVHFEMIDIFEYLKETQRVLRSGGRALYHHSNNTEDYKVTFSTGTRARNYMSAQLFAYLANRAGLRIVQQKIIDWGQIKNLDCLTLLEKE